MSFVRMLVVSFVTFTVLSSNTIAAQLYGRQLSAEYIRLPIFLAGFYARHQCAIFNAGSKIAAANYGSERDALYEVARLNTLFSQNPNGLFNVENTRPNNFSVELAEVRPSTVNPPAEEVLNLFGVPKVASWWVPAQNALLSIPPQANQTTAIVTDRLRRAVNSTEKVSFALFNYVNQLFYQPISDNLKEELRAQIARRTTDLYQTTENTLRTRARGFLLRRGVDFDLDAYENSITSSVFFRNQFTQELRWVRYIRLVGREYVLNENLPSRVADEEVLEEVKDQLYDTGSKVMRLERSCFENPNNLRIALARSWLLDTEGIFQLNSHHLSEAEFVYVFNKVVTPEQIAIEYPSQLYQTCFAK